MNERLTPESSLQKLAEASNSEFAEVFQHGTLSVEIYKPVKFDRQSPHSQDELYVVISGTGNFVNGSARHPFQPGEVLFVPAGTQHRFEDFTEDFATWVFFYGPAGEEGP